MRPQDLDELIKKKKSPADSRLQKPKALIERKLAYSHSVRSSSCFIFAGLFDLSC